MNETTRPNGPLWKRAATLVAVGLLGVAALALQPIPEHLLRAQPELAEVPGWALKLLGMLNPAVLLIVAALCGALVAHRVGLRSVLAGTVAAGEVSHGWGLAASLGLVTGVVLVGLDVMAAPFFGASWEKTLWKVAQPTPQSLAVGVFYGGITEEILMRWGLMSVLAWGLRSLIGQRWRGPALLAAAVLTALVFGAAHLPVLAAQVELTNAIMVRTLVLNGLAALVYAWVFWSHHLEAAMLSHACSHLAMGALWGLL